MQEIPSQWQGVGSDSFQEERMRAGSEEMADFRARRDRPSGVKEEVGVEKRSRRRKEEKKPSRGISTMWVTLRGLGLSFFFIYVLIFCYSRWHFLFFCKE